VAVPSAGARPPLTRACYSVESIGPARHP
jgi:hypothetical protein